MTLEGRFFPPNAIAPVPARAGAPARRVLRIEDEAGELLAEMPAKAVRVTARLAALARRIDLADGARFETADNDGADTLLRALRKPRRGRVTHLLERAWPAMAVVLIVALAAGGYLAAQAVPLATEGLARRLLPVVAHPMSEQALMGLDRYALAPTRLAAADRSKATALFARVAAHAHGGAGAYRLVFRAGVKVAPNAFALPDGTVVMTDQLWALVKTDAEIEGVFAHEMSHVDHVHAVQRVFAIALPAAAQMFAGDRTQVSHLSSLLPGFILGQAYTPGFERQADDDAAATLRALGAKPSQLADLLTRIDRGSCGRKGCGLSERIARLRAADRAPAAAAQDCWRHGMSGISLRCFTGR